MRIPLIDELLTEPLHAGSNILVEYDPKSQWLNASLTISAGWLKSGGKVSYAATTQSPDNVRHQLERLGLHVKELETNDKLQIQDWYTLTLGQKSKEKYAPVSLKVADLSIYMSRDVMRRSPDPDTLRVFDNYSTVARFNDEKAWVELVLTRGMAASVVRKTTAIRGIIRGIHSEWAYKQLEGAHDGVVEFKLDETAGETQDLMRVSTMRHVAFDRHWHRLKIGQNLEISLGT